MTRQLVIDTSYWTTAMDWNKAKSAGAAAMYTKASQLYADPAFPAFWAGAKGILPRGAYHYYNFGRPPAEQIKLFTDTMGGDWGELPPVIDLEQDPGRFGLPPREVQGVVWEWLQGVERITGRVPMIYCGFYFWLQWMTPDPAWAKYPFWLAWYEPEWFINLVSKLKGGQNGVPKPWKNWSMWQYTGNGNGPKYGSKGLSLDMNWCDNLDALLCGSTVPVPDPVPQPAYTLYSVIYARINIRSLPDSASAWVRYAIQNEQLKVVNIDSNGWAQLFDGTYAYADYLKKG